MSTARLRRRFKSPLTCGRLILLLAVLFMVTEIPLSARAGLGDSESAIETDRAFLKASTTVARNSKYSVHVMKTNGLTVREYVSPSGVVFAITWRGIRHPNINQLLSAYLPELEQAQNAQTKSMRRSNVTTTRLSLVLGGHSMDLTGKAIALDLLPSGMKKEDIL